MANDRSEQLFPALTGPQVEVAKRFASGAEQRFEPGAAVFEAGACGVPAYLVRSGTLDIVARDAAGTETVVVSHGPGQVAGEVSQLAGRPATAGGRAGTAGCVLLPFDAPHLRALLIGSAELGEILMRAFILRRTALITEGGGATLIGAPDAADTIRLRGFLARSGTPHHALDPTQAEGAELLERLGVHAADLPLLITADGTLLRNPSDRQVGARLGLLPEMDPARVFDVAIVGAGPAGLAAAVYAASEGLSVAVFDARSFGGQAGASARIENYLGFPTGISGQALAARAYVQAEKFGAEIAIPAEVEALDCGGASRKPGEPMTLVLADAQRVQARSVVVASGARYRRPDWEGLERYEGSGVSYWASPVEAQLCANETVALVGGGNSAGQAVAFLSPRVKRVHLVVRADGLASTMSRYLIDRIEAAPNVTLHTRAEIFALEGEDGHLRAARMRTADGEQRLELRHVFLFIGADPNAGWLGSCGAATDRRGFVRTGEDFGGEAWAALGRTALPLETSVPGVFAIGDVRSGSVKRVAGAVGEGAAVVAALHGMLDPAP